MSSGRYKIRTFESEASDNATSAGTVVMPTERAVAFYVNSADEAESMLLRDVANKKLPAGRVYQICPPAESAEALRSIAVKLDGSLEPCVLEPFNGLYSEFRRIRFQQPQSVVAETAACSELLRA